MPGTALAVAVAPVAGAGGVGGGGGNWWELGGASGAVAVYQPKGAASLAASYVNLANPGTYNAAPGVAPTWDTVNGWTGDGIGAYLTTGVIRDRGWSVLCRYTGATATDGYIFGARSGDDQFAIIPTRSGNTTGYYCEFSVAPSPATPAGVLGFSGQDAYKNGVYVATVTSFGSPPTSDVEQYLLAVNTGSASGFSNGSLLAIAYYNTTLTAPQVAAVSAAMAAL